MVETTGARGGECIVVTLAAANAHAFIFTDSGRGKLTALPTQGIVSIKQTGRAPARRARNAVVTRLNARVAYRAGLGIDERERGVVEMAGNSYYRRDKSPSP